MVSNRSVMTFKEREKNGKSSEFGDFGAGVVVSG